MGLGRLAGALLKRSVLPQGAGAIAMEFAPDALGTAFTMMSLPQGTSLQDRLLVGAEDLALGVGGSLGGRALGGLGGGMLNRGSMQRMAGAIESGAGMGGMAGGMGLAMFGPRPMYDNIQKRLEEQARQQQEAQMQGVFEQGIMAGAQHLANEPRVAGIDNILSGFYG